MADNEKTQGQKLAEELLYKTQITGEKMSSDEIKEAFDFNEGYKEYLDNAKTERLAVKTTIEILKEHGYQAFDYTKKYEAGDKIYWNNRGKSLLYAVIGTEPMEKGFHILASHLDSPRLDLKPRPLYEDADMAFFKTQYYGGVRKYQWVTMPLALHGTISKGDGSVIDVSIGEKETEPVFVINDLLPHLAQEQNKRTLREGIQGEELNVLIGSLPFKDDKASEKVKLNIMSLLHEKYGLVEEDFFSADLSLVPAFKARDVGFDRSLIGSYGHDDRVCAYPSIMATLAVENPTKTYINVLADREEIGSMGNTGLDSNMLADFVADIAKPHGVEGRTVLNNSKCLSADVNVGLDPTFPEVVDPRNSARIGHGVALTKYTGSGGKGGTSEATAEFAGYVRRLFNKEEVIWQSGELGRVDLGGGGTVALYIANLGVDVIDIGVPVLSMHAPYEVVSKLDVYQSFKGFRAFLAD